jgi:hypothetical protein
MEVDMWVSRTSKKFAVLKSYCIWSRMEAVIQKDMLKCKKFNGYLKDKIMRQIGFENERIHSCPLCAYTFQHVRRHEDITQYDKHCIKRCPLYNKWPSIEDGYTAPFCFSSEATYEELIRLTFYTDHKNPGALAGDIATALWKEYKKLGG